MSRVCRVAMRSRMGSSSMVCSKARVSSFSFWYHCIVFSFFIYSCPLGAPEWQHEINMIFLARGT